MNSSIGFAPDLIPLILNGSKKATYRLDNKYANLKSGDEIDFRDSQTSKVIGRIKITHSSVIPFKDVPIDSSTHERYVSKEQQKETFKRYYKREINDDEPVIIINFELIKVY